MTEVHVAATTMRKALRWKASKMATAEHHHHISHHVHIVLVFAQFTRDTTVTVVMGGQVMSSGNELARNMGGEVNSILNKKTSKYLRIKTARG